MRWVIVINTTLVYFAVTPPSPPPAPPSSPPPPPAPQLPMTTCDKSLVNFTGNAEIGEGQVIQGAFGGVTFCQVRAVQIV